MLSFRDKPLKERISIVYSVRIKYPDRIPICVYKEDWINAPSLDREKFLVSKEMTIGEFLYIIRLRIKLKPTEALFIFFDNIMLDTNSKLGYVYNKYKYHEDNMLYCTYSLENSFG